MNKIWVDKPFLTERKGLDTCMDTKHTNIQTNFSFGCNNLKFLRFLRDDLICRSQVCAKKNGEGYANLLETSVLSVSRNYLLVWNKAKLDLQELAVKRWVERWSVDRIALHFGCGRTAVVRKLGQLKRNPELILDGRARSHVKSRKHRFIGRS